MCDNNSKIPFKWVKKKKRNNFHKYSTGDEYDGMVWCSQYVKLYHLSSKLCIPNDILWTNDDPITAEYGIFHSV